jgi:hypothetical protein
MESRLTAMTTTQSQLEQIARECAVSLFGRSDAEDAKNTKLILTAANQIAALKVRESGAVEALDKSRSQLPTHGTYAEDWINRHEAAQTALRTIIKEGTP